MSSQQFDESSWCTLENWYLKVDKNFAVNHCIHKSMKSQKSNCSFLNDDWLLKCVFQSKSLSLHIQIAILLLHWLFPESKWICHYHEINVILTDKSIDWYNSKQMVSLRECGKPWNKLFISIPLVLCQTWLKWLKIKWIKCFIRSAFQLEYIPLKMFNIINLYSVLTRMGAVWLRVKINEMRKLST